MGNPSENQKVGETVKNIHMATSETMFNLYQRWQDEKEYEDIKDYGEVVRPMVEAQGATFLRMNKRPFGFKYILGEMTFEHKVVVRRNQLEFIGKRVR